MLWIDHYEATIEPRITMTLFLFRSTALSPNFYQTYGDFSTRSWVIFRKPFVLSFMCAKLVTQCIKRYQLSENLILSNWVQKSIQKYVYISNYGPNVNFEIHILLNLQYLLSKLLEGFHGGKNNVFMKKCDFWIACTLILCTDSQTFNLRVFFSKSTFYQSIIVEITLHVVYQTTDLFCLSYCLPQTYFVFHIICLLTFVYWLFCYLFTYPS